MFAKISLSCIRVLARLSLNVQTRRTLRMLYNEHSKAAKELQRRIAALREEGIDPTLPQKPAPPRPSPPTALSAQGSPPSPLPLPRGRMPDSQVDESFMLLGQQVRGTCISFPISCRLSPRGRSRRMPATHLTPSGGPWSNSITSRNL
jgi:hypothetical protein